MALPTVAEQAYHVVKMRILSGELLPGMKLREAALAAELGVSRTPLREAVTRLSEEGLVTLEARRGAYVAKLSLDEALEILEVRAALECQAARTAARKASREDVDSLRAMLREQETRLKKEPSSHSVFDFDFHESIVALSENNKLMELMDRIHNQLTILRSGSSFVPGRSAQALREHRRVVEALGSGDPDLAEDCMRMHLRNSRENIVRNVVAG